MGAVLVDETGVQPIRKKTPSIRYPATEFDLSSHRAGDRDTVYNSRDSKHNYEDKIQDVSYAVVRKKVQMDHVKDKPKLTDDEYKKIIDADNTKTKEVNSCMEICGN